jgi:hypothetical protein
MEIRAKTTRIKFIDSVIRKFKATGKPYSHGDTEHRKSAKCHFLIVVEQKRKDRLAAVSPSLTGARSSGSLECFPRSLIGAIEGSARFRQSCHECGP